MSTGEGCEQCRRCCTLRIQSWKKFTTRSASAAPVGPSSHPPRMDILHSAALFRGAAGRWVLVCIWGDKFIIRGLSAVCQCLDSPEAAAAAGPWQICVYVCERDTEGDGWALPEGDLAFNDLASKRCKDAKDYRCVSSRLIRAEISVCNEIYLWNGKVAIAGSSARLPTASADHVFPPETSGWCENEFLYYYLLLRYRPHPSCQAPESVFSPS